MGNFVKDDTRDDKSSSAFFPMCPISFPRMLLFSLLCLFPFFPEFLFIAGSGTISGVSSMNRGDAGLNRESPRKGDESPCACRRVSISRDRGKDDASLPAASVRLSQPVQPLPLMLPWSYRD
jgi:hypothetical protein